MAREIPPSVDLSPTKLKHGDFESSTDRKDFLVETPTVRHTDRARLRQTAACIRQSERPSDTSQHEERLNVCTTQFSREATILRW